MWKSLRNSSMKMWKSLRNSSMEMLKSLRNSSRKCGKVSETVQENVEKSQKQFKKMLKSTNVHTTVSAVRVGGISVKWPSRCADHHNQS
ncbi:hypothetical protein PoB_005839300 [Plakobranchus ocellatus]|uniref:Uncharacterized protein n=1 Tax=Plakobranchus ocellatus TaxID=259542 RepID=A0AAV4CL68_9GAST|nr:hypothetical protein PoB_005839300 [Plakobranchus ocellatus]